MISIMIGGIIGAFLSAFLVLALLIGISFVIKQLKPVVSPLMKGKNFLVALIVLAVIFMVV
jgi:hypothetical protein